MRREYVIEQLDAMPNVSLVFHEKEGTIYVEEHTFTILFLIGKSSKLKTHKFFSRVEFDSFICGIVQEFARLKRESEFLAIYRKEAKEKMSASISIGDIFYKSFHSRYGQNSEKTQFFQVVNKSGNSVIIREIERIKPDKLTYPLKDSFISDEKRALVKGYGLMYNGGKIFQYDNSKCTHST